MAVAAAAEAAAGRVVDARVSDTSTPAPAVRRAQLDSGLRVVTESLPGLRSVTIGAWVGSGARDENAQEMGASHFLEHLLFKGTETRGAREIAEAVESVGGEMNAFTTHEQTVFYVRVPDQHLVLALDILADVVWHPAFREPDIESERQVILEEIGMRDDTPDDLVHDVFARAMFPAHPLGNEVLGTDDSIKAMSRDRIARYHGAHYHPSNVVLAAAGNLAHDDVVALVTDRFPSRPDRRPDRNGATLPPAESRRVVSRPTEQAHIVVGIRAVPALDPDRYALTVVNQALGGGMASRLFQEIRETRGLAYSVYSYRAAYDDAGFLAVYAGTAPERVQETLEVIEGELDRLARDGLPHAELESAKGHLTGSLAMSLETSASRMRRIGRAELVEGEIPTLDEVVARVEAVDAHDIRRVVDRVFVDAPQTLAVVGPHAPEEFDAQFFRCVDRP
ncbi:MAG: M16 family metallopeptidase [Actinomycetota bacterium]